MTANHAQFIEFALNANVLRFGEFKTKAGRMSPYFFNAGLFNTGSLLDQLGAYYAKTLLEAKKAGRIDFDMLFGPAYKGIPLVSTVAMNLARLGCDVPWAFNRKEAKDHGEGGTVIGSPIKGRVVIVDDVISAGTSVRESVSLIRASGATPSGVLIALDRQERGGNAEVLTETSAVQDVEKTFNMPVVSIASLNDLLDFMDGESPAPRPQASTATRWRPTVRSTAPNTRTFPHALSPRKPRERASKKPPTAVNPLSFERLFRLRNFSSGPFAAPAILFNKPVVAPESLGRGKQQ